MVQLQFSAGDIICSAGDMPTSAFLIREGTVQLQPEFDGNSIVDLHPGAVFAEMSLILEKPHRFTARSLTDVQVDCMTRSEFEQAMTTGSESTRPFLNALLQRLRALSVKAESLQDQICGADDGIVVTIHPVTRRAAATLPSEGLFVDRYPFRIGRAALEKEDIPRDMNDLWLADQAPFHVSRTHLSIEREGDQIFIKDRGSNLGTIVNDFPIGAGNSNRKMALDDGNNTVIVGGRMSPYQFRISVEREESRSTEDDTSDE